LGTEVCREAWANLLGISNNKFQRLLGAYNSGASRAPRDLRVGSGRRARCAPIAAVCDAFLRWLYDNVAEPLAEQDLTKLVDGDTVDSASPNHHRPTINDALKEWVLGDPASTAGREPRRRSAPGEELEPKALPPGSITDLYEHFRCIHPDAQCCYTTFKTAYKVWHGTLRFRAHGEHARCTDCARLCKVRKSTEVEAEREAANKAYAEHIQSVLKDRQLDTRYDVLCETHFTQCTESPLLKLDLDGMDQSKFKVPRNLLSAKLWEKAWRPTLHCIGMVCPGLTEMYWFQDPDMKKGSNNQISLIVRALDTIEQELRAKGLPMPPHLMLRVRRSGAPSTSRALSAGSHVNLQYFSEAS